MVLIGTMQRRVQFGVHGFGDRVPKIFEIRMCLSNIQNKYISIVT